jgi:hypothetical protein
MRKHTGLRVGRTTRCSDFRAGLSAIATFRDLIPARRLFVFNRTRVRRAPRAGFPDRGRKGASAVMRHRSDLPAVRGTARLPGPVRAAQGRRRTSGGSCRAGCRGAGGGPGFSAGRLVRTVLILGVGRAGRGRSRGPGGTAGRCRSGRAGGAVLGRLRRLRGSSRRADTLVCVGPRAFWPLGAGSFGGARAIGSAGERLVHTEEVTGSIPVSPTSDSAGQPRFRPGLRHFVPVTCQTVPRQRPRSGLRVALSGP